MRIFFPTLLFVAVVLGCSGIPSQKTYTEKTQILNEDMNIEPLGWHSWDFSVGDGGRVNGSYTTASGVDHEIVFYIVDPANKDSIQKDQTGSFHFRSLDRTKNQHLQSVVKELPPGDYVLMFHNESRSAEHTVKVRMFLES